MLARIPGAVPSPIRSTGAAIGIIPALRIDTFVVQAQRAAESGMSQIIGPRALDFAMAARPAKCWCTVEEIVPIGALKNDGRRRF